MKSGSVKVSAPDLYSGGHEFECWSRCTPTREQGPKSKLLLAPPFPKLVQLTQKLLVLGRGVWRHTQRLTHIVTP